LKISIKGLNETLNKLKTEITKTSDKVVKDVSNELIQNLKKNTPVDTGKARDGWILKNKIGKVSVENDVPYILDLNEGHSEQAPSNFIEKTVLSNSKVKPNGIIVQQKYPNN
jgi:HK97 gp10 family phage protein